MSSAQLGPQAPHAKGEASCLVRILVSTAMVNEYAVTLADGAPYSFLDMLLYRIWNLSGGLCVIFARVGYCLAHGLLFYGRHVIMSKLKAPAACKRITQIIDRNSPWRHSRKVNTALYTMPGIVLRILLLLDTTYPLQSNTIISQNMYSGRRYYWM